MKKLLPRVAFLLLVIAAPVCAQDDEPLAADIDPALQQDLLHTHSLEEVQLLAAPLTLDQLTAEADEWQGLVQESMTWIANLKVAALTAEGDALSRIHEQINEVSIERNERIDKFQVIVDSLELKGGDPEAVKGYRNYISGALAAELQATDVQTMMSEAYDWTTSADGGVGFLVQVAIIVGALFVLLVAARLVRSLAARGIRRISHLSQLLQDFLLKMIFWLTFAIGLMIVLSLAGVNITPLFAVLGGASFILAFAMQETLGNLAAGLMIMINKPFDVGDLVDTNGVLGSVEAVSIVSTTVRTLDNQVVILPNSAVWGSIITNVTVSPVRRVDMVFGIGYGDDIETAQGVLEAVVQEHPLILDDPEPTIKMHELADSSVNFICRPWTKTEDYWTVYWDLTRQVKEQFDAKGVSIPFPQRDVHLYQEG
jgi:small conductance mechanosensitive channel